MSEGKKTSDQPDKGRAAEERPVPSQAEGDRETIEEDLREKNSEDKNSGNQANRA
jgi:hypothetical protein